MGLNGFDYSDGNIMACGSQSEATLKRTKKSNCRRITNSCIAVVLSVDSYKSDRAHVITVGWWRYRKRCRSENNFGREAECSYDFVDRDES